MKKNLFFLLLATIMVVFITNQKVYAYIFTYLYASVVMVGILSAVILMAVVANYVWAMTVAIRIEEWRDRDRYRAQQLRNHRHIGRLR